MDQVNTTAKADCPAPSGWAIVTVRLAGILVVIVGWRAYLTGDLILVGLGGLAMGAGAALALWGHAAFEAGFDRLFFNHPFFSKKQSAPETRPPIEATSPNDRP